MRDRKIVIVGSCSEPRSVVLIVGTDRVYLGPKAARDIAKLLSNMAEELEMTGGAAPDLEALDGQAATDEEMLAAGVEPAVLS